MAIPPSTTRVIDNAGPEWAAVESALLTAGTPLHVYARRAWATHSAASLPKLIVRETTCGPVAALGVQQFSSRVLPRHWLLRVERAGAMLEAADHGAFASALADLGRHTPGVLRVTAELVARDHTDLVRNAAAWIDAGFRRREDVRTWRRTLVVDLDKPEAEILSSFSQKPRRDLRALDRWPVTVRPIHEPCLVPRMAHLLRATYARTGGAPRSVDWTARVALAAAAPNLTRLVGLFRTDTHCDALIAFAWGVSHGDHATYEVGASDRPQNMRVPLLTPLLWDLMRWARCGGASWFDLGGISWGTAANGDPLGAISDYKRLFSRTEIEVGMDVEFEPRPLRARLARAASRLAGR